jgi:cold shock CspA family protein
MVGKVQTFYDTKGYGFLLEDFRTRIFFHVTQWRSSTPPQEGMLVTYDLIPSHKAGFQYQAGNITPIKTELNAEQTDAFVIALNDSGAQ